ncbi:MAG: hypothetical protein ACJ8ED_09675 [Xanthobacteraceae bacterium]
MSRLICADADCRPLRSRCRCRTDAGGYRPRDGALLQELLDQVGKNRPCEGAVVERNAGDIPPANPGEMSNDFASFGITENKPWVAFVGDAAVSPDGKSARPHEFCRAMQMPHFVLGPALLMRPHVGEERCPSSHG